MFDTTNTHIRAQKQTNKTWNYTFLPSFSFTFIPSSLCLPQLDSPVILSPQLLMILLVYVIIYKLTMWNMNTWEATNHKNAPKSNFKSIESEFNFVKEFVRFLWMIVILQYKTVLSAFWDIQSNITAKWHRLSLAEHVLLLLS